VNIHEYQAREIFGHRIPVPAVRWPQPRGGGGRSRPASAAGSSSRRRSMPAGAARPAGSSSRRSGRGAGEGSAILGMEIKGLVCTRCWWPPPGHRPRVLPGRGRGPEGGLPLIMASREGGIDIEEVAATRPPGDRGGTTSTRRPGCARSRRGRSPSPSNPRQPAAQIAAVLQKLCVAFAAVDASLAEIKSADQDPRWRDRGPRRQGHLDDNALFRHPELAACAIVPPVADEDEARQKRGFPSSSSKGRSAASSTGAGWPWPPWTGEALRGRPANFLDIGAPPTRRRSSPPSRSSPTTRM